MFFGKSPNFVHQKFKLLYQEKVDVLVDYLHLTPEESLDVFIHQPFLLKCSTKVLRSSILFFLNRRNQVLTRERIVSLLKTLGEAFLLGYNELNQFVGWVGKWGLTHE